MSEHLLLNLMLSITPVFAYQFILFRGRLERESAHTRVIMGTISGLASVLCMAFPLVSGTDFVWDLRWVPFLVAVLYGGLTGATTCALIMLSYRALLGGPLAWAIVLVDSIVIISAALWFRRFLRACSMKKCMTLNVVLSAGTCTIVIFSIYLYFVMIHKTEEFIHHGLQFFLSYGVVTIAAYITSVLLIENMLEHARLREQLQQANELHVMGELAAAMAHEIRNPLTVVAGFTHLWANSHTAINPTHLNLVNSELNRANEIIDDYLNFARPQPNHPDIVGVPAICGELIEIVTPYATMNGVAIHYEVAADPEIYCDTHKFRQSVMNILKNAVEALPQGGNVSVTVGEEQGDVLITVEDDGLGMTQTELSRLGKPFYSTKSKGTGLGLMITFRNVEAMGGTIQIGSVFGKGTRVLIKLSTHKKG